ncbi:MAG: hypothetical protein Fur0019_17060 [Tibeticola sp.]
MTSRDPVRRSVPSRKRAIFIFDTARRAVEIAIKDSEVSALAYLAAANPPEAAT